MEINLMLGDCLERMKEIPDGIVDLILTDPPYGTTACKWDTVIDLDLMWAELKRIIKPNGAVVLFGSEPFSSALRMSNIKNYKYDWIWHKNMGGSFALCKKQPLKRHEIVSVFYNKQCTYNPQFEAYSESTRKRFKQGEKVNRNTKKITNQINGGINYEGIQSIDYKRGTYPTTVKFFKRPHTANGASFHPTQKPVALMEYLIKTYTNENELVLDFTMGSFTTAIACLNTKRNFIGIELDDYYFEVGTKRVNEHLKTLDYVPKIKTG